MTVRHLLSFLLALGLGACGVKNDLLRPPMEVPGSADDSKPPVPLGEPGGRTPPYPTGP